MSINLHFPQSNTIVGEYPIGNKIAIKHLASGYDVNVPIRWTNSFSKGRDSEYKPTCGIEISEILIHRNSNGETKWSKFKHVPHEIVRKLILEFFEKIAWPDFQNQVPNISKQDAFGMYVVLFIPKKIPNWNSTAWQLITENMIKEKQI